MQHHIVVHRVSNAVQKQHVDNVVHCTQDGILYTVKGRLNAGISFVRRLIGLAEVILKHVNRQSR